MSNRALLVGTLLLALLVLPIGAAMGASKAPSPKRQTATAFKNLKLDTSSVPKKNISKKNKRRLLKIVATAKRQSLRKTCKSLKTLKTYRRRLKVVHEPKLRRFELNITTIRGALQADVLTANIALLQLPRARKCGGGHPSTVTQTAPKIVESDTNHVRLKVALPPPTFVSHTVGGSTYQQVFMNGMGETGDVGDPGLPKVTEYLGVPQGASVEMTVNGSQGYDLDGVNLFPHQEEAVDLPGPLPPGAADPGTFTDPPFSKDGKAYKSNAKFPAKASTAGGLGTMRGLAVGGVDFAGGQFQPKKGKLHVFTSIDVTVKFGGGNTGKFGDGSDLGGRWNSWFQQNYKGLVDNYGTVAGNFSAGDLPQFCGEEMLVVTSPDLQPAANTFAAAKNAQGFFTKVKLTGNGAGQIGTTKEQIQSFIRGELTAKCSVRPQFVVLLGNTAAVPTFILPCTSASDIAKCDVATDLPYSLDGVGTDLFADVMLGRIPATSPQNAVDVVNKIVNYENNMPAPAGDDFYKHATVTGYWQPSTPCYLDPGESGTPNCDPKKGVVNGHNKIDYTNHRESRGFTLYSHKIIQAAQHDSYNVDRLWTTDNKNVVPEQFQDGTDIPNNLRRPQFAWDASTQDVLDAYNGGRFMVFHRDHGSPSWWGAPDFTTAELPSLTNGTKLPVIFGVDCESDRFDNPASPSLVEQQIELPTNGAVAGFGDTRVSPSNPNNHMALGFADALFPAAAPDFGSDTPSRRLGDVLLSGKAYMASQVGVEGQGSGDTEFEHYLYHLMGDPSMQMWAATPLHFDLPNITTVFRNVAPVNPGDPVFQVELNFAQGAGAPPAPGTVATLLHDGAPIGRAVVGSDGKATIVPDVKTDTSKLTVALEQDGALPATDAVDQGNSAQPTSLTLTGPSTVSFGKAATFTGNLSPAVPGAQVKVVYTQEKQNGKTIEHTVAATDSGDYRDSVTIARADAGKWHAQATYAGDTTHGASSSAVVNFTVGG